MFNQDLIQPKVEKPKQYTEFDVLLQILRQLNEINDQIRVIASALQSK